MALVLSLEVVIRHQSEFLSIVYLFHLSQLWLFRSATLPQAEGNFLMAQEIKQMTLKSS